MIALYRLLMLGFPVKHSLNPQGTLNGGNSIFRVVMKPKGACSHYAGVRFQEHVEQAFQRMIFLLVYILAAAAGYLATGHWLAFAAALIPAFLVRAVPAYQRQLEMRGQSVESYIRHHYYGENYDDAELKNGEQLTGPSYQRGFNGRSGVQISAELRRWRGWAEKMCKAFEVKIREWAQ